MDEEIIKKSFFCTGISSSNYEDFHKTVKLVLESKQAPETVLVNQEPGVDLFRRWGSNRLSGQWRDDDDEGYLEDEDEEDAEDDGDDGDDGDDQEDDEDEEDDEDDGDIEDDHEDEDEDGDDVEDEDVVDEEEEKEETDGRDDQENEEKIDNDALENESESDHELPPLYPYIYVPKSSKFKSEKYRIIELIFISLHN